MLSTIEESNNISTCQNYIGRMIFAIWRRVFRSCAAKPQTVAWLLRSEDSTSAATASGPGGREGETETEVTFRFGR
jgi:hypothetical protein